jgi:NAD(P)-dependent dehydrogenase (short-subunit alcohol dehydrogenase family)
VSERRALVTGGTGRVGRAIAARLEAERFRVLAAGRADGDLSRSTEARALVERAVAELGGLDLVVNAVSASRAVSGPFGGGPVAEATLEGYRGWGGAVGEQAFVFLSEGARALRGAGGGTLVQVTGGSARRAMAGRGLWASGAAATRALTHAAAQELREEGIHVALLIVDATIESPKTAAFTRGQPPEAMADQADVARAVAYLAAQTARGLTHELVLTPAGDRWLP